MKRKIFSLLLVVFTLFCMVACGGKSKVACELVDEADTRVVIRVTEAADNATVLDCMEYLSGKGDFSYKISGGMVMEINGKANTADFSGCWMLYTSDAEMANTEWGTIEYDGKTIASAIVGAEALTVVVGEVYIWEYVTF